MMLILHPKIIDFLQILASKMAPKLAKNGDQNRSGKGPWKLTENGCQKGSIFESASSAPGVDPDQSPLPNLPLYTRRAQTGIYTTSSATTRFPSSIDFFN